MQMLLNQIVNTNPKSKPVFPPTSWLIGQLLLQNTLMWIVDSNQQPFD